MPKDQWASSRLRDKTRRSRLRQQKQDRDKHLRRSLRGKSAKPELFVTCAEWIKKIEQVTSDEQLDAIGRDINQAKPYIWSKDWTRIVVAGITKRRELAD
jgi:hypothetical protein